MLVNINIDVVLEMPFFMLNNIEINFLKQKFNWSLYIIIETLLTTKQIELIEKKEFVTVAFDLDIKIFVMHIAFLVSSDFHPLYRVKIAFFI